ncbi:unnamed protein product [Darwinula stevensoni]|uniref:Peptidoglycan-recognition protein n=1 Tax=Darwinula stevensoni TaxID=69355 RepID=A0A7R9FR55_9CRUS|nr:unnamed protein product [Darwinula stevensoni]CAG0900370.1 unnamed protein product [Darwinula stevensoni]
MKWFVILGLLAPRALSQGCGGNPRIVTREEWGARPPNSETSMSTPVPFVIIHHTVTPHCHSISDCIPLVQLMQDLHMDTNGWDDIGYRQAEIKSPLNFVCLPNRFRTFLTTASDFGHVPKVLNFLVGEDGNVYEGRGWDRVGAHTPGFNSRGIAISVIGNYMEVLPNSAAMNTIEDLIDCGIGLGKIQSGYSLMGHRQASATLCPGDMLYDEITTWDHFDPSPSR